MSGHVLPSLLPVVQEERSQCLWAALEKIIPDVRLRAELALVGTPLTHERFLRRYRGTYGELRGACISGVVHVALEFSAGTLGFDGCRLAG